jgi:uncharacterized protein
VGSIERRSRLAAGIEVRPSPIEGSGLFATRPFAADEVVAVLGGRVVDDAGWAAAAARGPVSGYAIGEGRHLVQDDDDDARFGNHSCDPTTWLVDDVTLVARRAIQPGEELTSDYATMTADPSWSMPCDCGAASCRGTIRAGRSWPQSERRSAGAPISTAPRRGSRAASTTGSSATGGGSRNRQSRP